MKKIALLVSLAFIFTAGVMAQATEPVKVENNPNGPEISFEKTVHDYGTIPYGGNGVCTLNSPIPAKNP